MKYNVDTSIIICTRNAGDLFKKVMAGVFNQDYAGNYEVIVIDSSSEDNTDKIAKKYPAKVIIIKPEDFGHGKTRNYGARIARGENLVFLTHDAVPRNRKWLSEIVKDLNKRNIAGIFGRQIARDHAVPMEKFFYFKMYGEKSILWNKKNIQYDEIIFSNANSAIKRSFLLKNPFPEDILMSEDREWALNMIDQGYSILYQSSATVTHSHDTRSVNLFKRYFDFGVSHSEIGNSKNKSNFVGKGMSVFIDELKYLIAERKILWIPRAFFYNFTKFAGLMAGKNQKYIPKPIKLTLSGYKGYWQ
jgi:rhamnosyltransferase